MKDRRVVITGIGVVSPLGCDANLLFNNLLIGKKNFSQSTSLKRNYPDSELLTSNVSNDFEEECASYNIPVKRSLVNYAKLAGKKALESANITSHPLEEISMFIGTCDSYTFDPIEYANYKKDDIEIKFGNKLPYGFLSDIGKYLQIKGEIAAFPIACSSGNVAITVGTQRIKYYQDDICLVGGVDFLNDNIYSTFYCLDSISKSTCKPFDKTRDGIIIGEGAAFLVLESYENALKRGANILAEIIGYNISCDAHHLTTPNQNGTMSAVSILKALKMANISPEDIDYISPHATGTIANDLHEANAMYKVFGEKLSQKPISAIKSMLGHCMGAASAIEAVVSIVSLNKNRIPKTINSSGKDPNFPCDLNVCNYKSDNYINIILSNSFAFGGNICCVVFKKYNSL